MVVKVRPLSKIKRKAEAKGSFVFRGYYAMSGTSLKNSKIQKFKNSTIEKKNIPATLVRVLTPSVSPNEKTFKVVLVCCSHDPSPHPTSIFGGFSGSFASVCSRPSGVPIISPLFLAAFEHTLHLFVVITSSALPVTH